MEGGRPADDLSVENAVMTATVKVHQRYVENTLAGSSASTPADSTPPNSSAPVAGEQPLSPFAVPFIIDPSSQITPWLLSALRPPSSTTTAQPSDSQAEETNNASSTAIQSSAQAAVDVIQQNNPKFLSQLELAVKWSKILIVQEGDHIEPLLLPLLRRELSKPGTALTVMSDDGRVQC